MSKKGGGAPTHFSPGFTILFIDKRCDEAKPAAPQTEKPTPI
jgi:hypothetical protein